jgi:peptidoglycan/LPS O-acetylase OafA/YrhL
MSSTDFVASDKRLIMQNTMIAAAVTLALNLTLYFIGDAAGWIPDELPERAEQFGIPALILSTVVPILIGGVVLAILVRTTNHPVLMFCLIASVAFIATLVAPLSIAGASTTFRTFLVALHLVTVVVGTVLLVRNVEDEPE